MTAILAQARTATPGEQLIIDARSSAISLITRVRTDDIDAVWAHLAAMPAHRLHALIVVLAAMVPLDADPDALLEWLNDPAPERAIARAKAAIRANRRAAGAGAA